MMDTQLTLPMLLRRSESYFGDKELVTRMPDRSFHRQTYAETGRRARALAVGLQSLGLERGDRVATLCWNHHAHHEAYLGIPCGGFVLHTLNLRLHPADIGWIAKHAGDRVVIVDRQLLPLLDQFRERTNIERVLVVEDGYEELLAGADPDAWEDPQLDENEAAFAHLVLLPVELERRGAAVDEVQLILLVVVVSGTLVVRREDEPVDAERRDVERLADLAEAVTLAELIQ